LALRGLRYFVFSIFRFPDDEEAKELDMTRCTIVYGKEQQRETGLGKNKRTAQAMACFRALRKLKE